MPLLAMISALAGRSLPINDTILIKMSTGSPSIILCVCGMLAPISTLNEDNICDFSIAKNYVLEALYILKVKNSQQKNIYQK